MPKVETVASYLSILTYREQLILCNLIRTNLNELKYAHLTPALLPFVCIDDAREAVNGCIASRPIAVLVQKLKMKDSGRFPMTLDTKKVTKVFGPDLKPRRFNWLPRAFSKGKPMDPVVQLRIHKRSMLYGDNYLYTVIVHQSYKAAVLAWLEDNLA